LRTVSFLVLPGVCNSELMAPYDVLDHVRFRTKDTPRVFTVAPKAGPLRTFEGLRDRPGRGGANLVCFTTGRRSVLGCVPAPFIKLATHTPVYRRMTDDMNVNCGGIADGEETVEACGRRIYDLILRVASGEKSKSEALADGCFSVRITRGANSAMSMPTPRPEASAT
jgi:hypothetical protein